MFDKLIESNSAEAEFKPRRKFFMMSSVVVGILFLSALVFSLYAADIDLGTDNFELVQILAPTETEVPEPEPPREQPQQKDESPQSDIPVRNQLIASIEQTPADSGFDINHAIYGHDDAGKWTSRDQPVRSRKRMEQLKPGRSVQVPALPRALIRRLPR